MEQEKNAKKSKKGLVITIVSILVVAILAVVALVITGRINGENTANAEEQERLSALEQERLAIIESPTIHEGITVGGVDVGGLTKEQAQAKLKAATNTMLLDKKYTLSINGEQKTISAGELGASFDAQAAAEEAMAIGREGDYETLTAQIARLKEEGQDIPLTITADESAVRAAVQTLAAEVDQPPVDATVKLGEDGKFEYVESQTGLAVDQEALTRALLAAIGSDDADTPITVDVQVSEPAVTTETLKQKLVKRSSFKTNFSSSSSNRKYNVTRASGLINGKVVHPGETFSMNDTLGTRTYAAGWKPAPAIVKGGGDTEMQAGGGVCQASTTLYNAVLKADLEIVFRQAHSTKLGYVDGGLDATINSVGNLIDFKFRNNTATDIIIISFVDKSFNIHVEIYGEPFGDEFDEIRLSSKRVATLTPGGMRTVKDPTKPEGYEKVTISRKNGSRWVSYKHYYKNGKEVRTEVVATTNYRAVGGEKVVGTGKPSATPTPAPSKSAEPAPSKSTAPEPSKSKEPEPSKSKEPEPSKSKEPEPSKSTAPEPSKSKEPEPSKSKAPEPSKSQEADKGGEDAA